MRKNKMMRMAGVLLIAVLLTTSIISGTFAKYVTSDSVKDQARVAKFGVVVAGEGSLFAKSYFNAEETDGNEPGETVKDNKAMGFETLTVETSNGDKLVAPGTKNEDGMTISVTGTPEVDVLVTINFSDVVDVFLAENDNLPDMTTGKDAYFANDEIYYPIVFKLAGTFVEYNWKAIKDASAGYDTIKLNKADSEVTGRLEDVVGLMEDVFGDGIYVDANTDLAEVIGSFTLTWEWQYVQNENNPDKVTDRDRKDTLLGNLASYDDGEFGNDEDLIPEDKYEAFEDFAASDNYSLDIALKMSVTVTQVD